MNPSATRVLETERMYSEAREALSLAVCDRAPWSVKCSVVSAVKSSWRSGASATARTVLRVIAFESGELLELAVTGRKPHAGWQLEVEIGIEVEPRADGAGPAAEHVAAEASVGSDEVQMEARDVEAGGAGEEAEPDHRALDVARL